LSLSCRMGEGRCGPGIGEKGTSVGGVSQKGSRASENWVQGIRLQKKEDIINGAIFMEEKKAGPI